MACRVGVPAEGVLSSCRMLSRTSRLVVDINSYASRGEQGSATIVRAS
jgi:hypothetical protein